MRVNHTVRKAREPAASDLGAEQMPGLRKALNELKDFERFDQKRITQAGRLLRVPCYGFVQLSLRRLQQPATHALLGEVWYLVITSDSATALTSPRR